MGIHNSENKGEIIDFALALAKKQKQSTCETTQHQVETILEGKEEKFSKGDLIGALINLSNTQANKNLATDLLQVEYKKLLFNLYDGICQEFGHFYHIYGLDLIFDSKDFCIYLGEKDTQVKQVKLDIALVSNQDFSETHIIISHNGNEMFFFKNHKASGRTNYIPSQIKTQTLKEEFLQTDAVNDIPEDDKNKKYHTIISQVLFTHFPHFVDLYKGDFETINDFTTDDLFAILKTMIYLELKEELSLEKPENDKNLLQRRVEKNNQIVLEDLQIGFDLSMKTQNIYLLNNGEIFAALKK